MPHFSVIVLTASPPGQRSEGVAALLRIDGKETVLRAAELFLNRDEIKQILVVFDPAELDKAKKNFGHHFAFAGIKLVSGGPTWIDQISAAAGKLDADTSHVMVHDGARCCVPYSDLDAILEETGRLEAGKAPLSAALVTPLKAALLEVDPGGQAVASHAPGGFVQLLSPQGYTRQAFDVVAKSRQDVHPAAIRTVKGSHLNVRMSCPGDERFVKTIMGILPKPVKKVDGPFGEAQW